MAGNVSAPATGLSYRSTISGRLLGTDVDVTHISPMLREGRPPRPEDAKAMATAPKRKLGAFVYQPKAVGISTAMVPLSAVRGVTVSTVEGAGLTYRPGDAQAATDYAAAVAEEPSDAASAGSYLPSGPANNDPDGISAAVSTMRRFRRMLEAGHSKSKGAPPIFQPMREHNTRFDAAASRSGHGHGGDDEADGADVDWNATVVPSGKPLLNGASADLASAVSVNAAGTSVVGTLVVKRNCLMRATMIAAKWTRIVNTQYGASAADPVCIVVEMQRTYHTAFLDDMHEATGGDFMFKTEPAPTAIVANIGAINLLLKAGETDFSKHLLPPHASNSKKRFTVIGGTLAARSLAGQGDAISIARAASEFGNDEAWPEAGGGSPTHAASGPAAESTALVRYRGGSGSPTRRPRGGTHPGSSAAGALSTLGATSRSRDGGGFDGGDGGTMVRAGASHSAPANGGGGALTKFSSSHASAATTAELGSSGGRGGGGPATMSDPFGADAAGLDAEMRTKAKYEAPLVYRGEVAVSKAVLDSQEFLTEKRKGLLRAGRKLRAAAIKGDTKEMARLVIRGEAIYFDPRPWYLRDMRAVDNPEGDTPANNPHVVKTDAVVRPTVDWCEADGLTALMHAVRAGNPDSVRALAEMGADSHRKCREGLHAIDMARTACDEASEALRRHLRGAVEARKRAAEVVAILDTRTIWEAVQDGDQHRLRILLNTGAAAVNAANPYGMTALHFAVLNRDAEAALLLVKHGANPHRRNNLGQTPASLLEEIEAKGTKAKLLEAFSGGKAEDAERRARERAKLSQEAADQALLLTFERKLRTLTRGTTAAKTLRALNDLSKAAARPAVSAGGGGGGAAGRGRSASPSRGAGGGPGGGSSRPATGFGTRPGSRAAGTFLLGADAMDARPATASTAVLPPMSPFALDRSRPSTSVRGSKLVITSAEAVRYSGQPGAACGGGGHAAASSGAGGGGDAMTDLYAASHQRHARDYIALAMKEQQVAGAKALGASLARSGPLSPASRGGGGGLGSPGAGGAAATSASATKLTSDDVEHHAFERFFAAKAPHPADRKFDVYFKAHTGGRLQV